MAGTLAGTHAGFAIAEQIDPLTHTQGSVVGRLFQVAAIAAFFSYGLHHALIEAFAGLAVAAPPGTASLSPDFLRALIVEGGELLPLALQATMPALAASLLLNLIFAIVTRFSPAMNLYFGLGMALQCAVGVAALSACLPAVLRAFAVCASALPLAGAAG
jgi:flagellar biosynthesis protein FliR